VCYNDVPTKGYGGDYYENNGWERVDELKEVTPYPHNAKVTNKMLDKLKSQATLFETSLINNFTRAVALQKFFGGDFQSQGITKNIWEGNIFRYGIYKLTETGKIKLYSFDNQAAVAQLQISLDDTVPAPVHGRFVLVLNDGDEEEKVVLDITPDPYNMYFEFSSPNYTTINKFCRLIEQTAEEVNFYKNKIFTFDGRFVKVPKLSLEDAILPEKIKTVINENVIVFLKRTMPILEANGLPTKRGLIFSGPPGTGKTFCCRVLAASVGVSFMIISSVSGAESVRRIFRFARKISPTVILFEDVDIYMMNRESNQLSSLLNELDGIEENKRIITILTTNKPEFLDKAISNRPGRFDRILNFEPPDSALTKHMLETFTKNVNTSEIDFNELSQKFVSEGYTGAHLREIVLTACMQVAQKMDKNGKINLRTEDLLEASKKVNPLRSNKMGFNG